MGMGRQIDHIGNFDWNAAIEIGLETKDEISDKKWEHCQELKSRYLSIVTEQRLRYNYLIKGLFTGAMLIFYLLVSIAIQALLFALIPGYTAGFSTIISLILGCLILIISVQLSDHYKSYFLTDRTKIKMRMADRFDNKYARKYTRFEPAA